MKDGIFDALLANEQLKTYISGKIADSQLPHALIFEGADGSGKSTVAKMTAAVLAPDFAEKIMEGISPDVTFTSIPDDKKTIGVDQIREIKLAAYVKPQELDIRVFIVENTETMTVQAQNALLKILEEPPKGVYFFLLCENASMLLPTVRSRAPVLKMGVFSDSELEAHALELSKKALVMKNSSPDAFAMLVRSCSGSLGALLDKLGSSEGDAERLRKITGELLKFLSESKKDETLLLFYTSKMKRNELDSVLSLLEYALRDMMKVKYGTLTEPLYFTDINEAEEMSGTFTRAALMALFDACEELRQTLTYNVAAEAFGIKIADILSKCCRK